MLDTFGFGSPALGALYREEERAKCKVSLCVFGESYDGEDRTPALSHSHKQTLQGHTIHLISCGK